MKFFDQNPRQITKEQFDRLASDMDAFGDLGGIVHDLNSDQVIGGNQRVRVIDLDKIEPVIYEAFNKPTKKGTVAYGYVMWCGERFSYRQVRWSPEMCLEANIKANIDGGTWDFEIIDSWGLPVEVLEGWGFDDELAKSWHNDAFALEEMRATDEEPKEAPEPQIDKAEELRKKWGVSLGQLWSLDSGKGCEHRLICGDCTDRAVVERVMGGERAAIGITSPPYNVAAQSSLPNKNKYAIGRHKYGAQSNDKKSLGEYLELLAEFTKISIDVSEYLFVNVQSVAGNKLALIDYLCQFKDVYGDTIVWDKEIGEPAMAHNVLNSRFEYVHIFSKKANRAIGTKEFRGTIDNVLSLNSRQDKENSDIHKATFPIAFCEFFVGNFSNKSELIYEPFNGTGTCIIACENLNRRCRAIEIDPGYVGVSLERFFQHTGIEPILLS